LKIVNDDDELENNIFKKLKKINPEIENSSSSSNIIINRMNILEDKIDGLNNKMDLILQLLYKNDI
jgi:hypothetical protein